MKHLFLLMTFCFANVAHAATNSPANLVHLRPAFAKLDFSPLLKPKTDFLGYIGDHYQRLKIFYDSIEKDKSDPALYHVKGHSEVKGNHVDFTGTLQVSDVSTIKVKHYGVDDEYKPKGIKTEGRFTAKYDLHEKESQKDSGHFEGTLTLDWYIDKKGKLTYDDIQNYSDNYSNNQYMGAWFSYAKNSKGKVANWGEFRVPLPGDLDIGAGEFSPNPKYKQYGW